MDDHGMKWHGKIAKNFKRLSRVHECYRHTDGRQHIANVNLANVNASSRSLKLAVTQHSKSETS